MKRNIQLYPYYVAFASTLAWMPIFFLYFNQHVSLDQVLLLEAIYYFAVVLLEVPSGYFSDTVGRRPTLLISSAAFSLSYGLFFVGSGFVPFALAQILLAAGFAFQSGTDTSFHYDSLATLKQTNEYAQREAMAQRNGFMANAAAIFIGGAVGMLSLRLAYGISLLGALIALLIVWRFREPEGGPTTSSPRSGFMEQLRICIRYLQRPPLLWLFAFVILMTIINHIPYEFYQPYIDLLRSDLALADSQTPLVTGIIGGLSTLLGAYAAARSIWLQETLGIGPTLLLATGIQVLLITAMGFFLHPIVVPLLLLRTLPEGGMRAPLNAAIAPQVAQEQRATYLSIQSLAGRLAFSIVLFGLSILAGVEGQADWPSVAWMLRISMMVGLVGFIGLALTRRVLGAEYQQVKESTA